MDFYAPARGRLVASCRLDQNARLAVEAVLAAQEHRAHVRTVADFLDENDALVCRGAFEWSVRRLPDSV